MSKARRWPTNGYRTDHTLVTVDNWCSDRGATLHRFAGADKIPAAPDAYEIGEDFLFGGNAPCVTPSELGFSDDVLDFLSRHKSHHDAARSPDIHRPNAADFWHKPKFVLRRNYVDVCALQSPRANQADSFFCAARQLIEIRMAHLAQGGICSPNEQWARQYKLVASIVLDLTDQSARLQGDNEAQHGSFVELQFPADLGQSLRLILMRDVHQNIECAFDRANGLHARDCM